MRHTSFLSQEFLFTLYKAKSVKQSHAWLCMNSGMRDGSWYSRRTIIQTTVFWQKQKGRGEDWTSYLLYSIPKIIIKYDILDELIITISLRESKSWLKVLGREHNIRNSMLKTIRNWPLICKAYWKQDPPLCHTDSHLCTPTITNIYVKSKN